MTSLAALRQELAWLEANTVGVAGERAAALESWLNVRRGLAELERTLAAAEEGAGRRPEDELLDELAAARVVAADVRSSCLRRAERLLRAGGQVAEGRGQDALQATRQRVLAIAAEAQALLEVLAGDLGELVAPSAAPGDESEEGGPPRGGG